MDRFEIFDTLDWQHGAICMIYDRQYLRVLDKRFSDRAAAEQWIKDNPMHHGFDKYELPSRVSLVLSHYAGGTYQTSDDVLADRERLIAKLDELLARKGDLRGGRIGAAELRRDLIAGHPRGAVTLQAIKQMEK